LESAGNLSHSFRQQLANPNWRRAYWSTMEMCSVIKNPWKD
jgi:hypothetical protein